MGTCSWGHRFICRSIILADVHFMIIQETYNIMYYTYLNNIVFCDIKLFKELDIAKKEQRTEESSTPKFVEKVKSKEVK